ncbi:MAG TPA: Omp28-related outer membrane protein [Saprospiraceae bacterium]|nr:Omp28-related outer membrane protein [Saprospiraceae bacterium]
MNQNIQNHPIRFVGANSNKSFLPLHGVCSGSIRRVPTLLLFVFIISMFSCDEQRRIIEPFVPAGNRVVLLEEFTGKGCTNCPKGSREIENLLTLFPNNLVAVSIHAGFFANPQFFPLGDYDFRTMEGDFLYDYLTHPIGYPSGVVNRTPVSGDLQISANAWSSAISTQIQIAPAVEITIVHSFNAVTRELEVTVNGIGKEVVSGDIRLSIMITESGIVDAQDDQEAGGVVQDYVHKHVLRGMLTPAEGISISTGLTVGQTFSESFTRILDAGWNTDHMDIVAFVSEVNGNNFPVLQAAGVKL